MPLFISKSCDTHISFVKFNLFPRIDICSVFIFSALHGMPARTSDEKAVCLSVCLYVRLFVKRVNCDKTEERSLQIFIPHERPFSLVEKKNGWWGRPLLPKISGQPVSIGVKSPILYRYLFVAPQPWHLAKKVQLTLIGSPLRAFQWA